MKDFLKTTIIGGVLFLLPVALISLVLGHAMRLAVRAVQPVEKQLGLDQMGTVAGVGTITLLAVAALIVVSFIAGIVARTALGTRLSGWFEDSLMGGLPQYRMVKTMAEGFMQFENTEGMKPALVSIEDGWQIGYVIEPISDGWVAVFLPQAPTPLSGNVMYFTSDRVRPLDITMVQATALVKRIGIGSAEILQGANLKPAAAG